MTPPSFSPNMQILQISFVIQLKITQRTPAAGSFASNKKDTPIFSHAKLIFSCISI